MDRSRFINISIVALWIAGFVLSLPIIGPQELARLGAITCLLLSGIMLVGTAWGDTGLKIPRSRLLSVAALFWFLAFASLFWSVSFFSSFLAFGTFCLFPAGFIFFSLARERDDKIIERCFAGGMIVIAALAVWAVVQFVFFPDMLVYGQVRQPFANPNSYAALLALGLFGCLGFFMSLKQDAKLRHAALGAAVFCACAIIVTGSRSVMIFSALSALIFLWLMRGVVKQQWKVLLVATLVLVAAYSFFSMRVGPDGIGGRFEISNETNVQSLGARLKIWSSAGEVLKDAPLFGHGYGTFHLLYPSVRKEGEISAGIHAHNDPLQFWAELGVAGPFLFYMFCVLAFLRMAALWQERKETKKEQDDAIPNALFCAFGVLIAHAHFSFDFYVAPILYGYGLALALWFRETGKTVGRDTMVLKLPAGWPQAVRWAILLVPVAGLLYCLQGVYRSSYYVGEARTSGLQAGLEEYARDVNNAATAGFGWNPMPFMMAANIPIAMLEKSRYNIVFEEQKSLLEQAVNYLDAAERANSKLAQIYFQRATVYRLVDPALADTAPYPPEYYLLQGLAVDPSHLPSRMLLADIYREQGEQDKEWELLIAGLDQPPFIHDPSAYYTRITRLAAYRRDEDIQTLVIKKVGEAMKMMTEHRNRIKLLSDPATR